MFLWRAFCCFSSFFSLAKRKEDAKAVRQIVEEAYAPGDRMRAYENIVRMEKYGFGKGFCFDYGLNLISG